MPDTSEIGRRFYDFLEAAQKKDLASPVPGPRERLRAEHPMPRILGLYEKCLEKLDEGEREQFHHLINKMFEAIQ